MVSTNLGDRLKIYSDRLKIDTIIKTRVKSTYKIKIAPNLIVGFFSSWLK